MAVRLFQLAVGAHDLPPLARFRCAVPTHPEGDEFCVLRPRRTLLD